MVVFANLAGQWTELTGNDTIENEPAQIFVNDNLSKLECHLLNDFLCIEHSNFIYHVHISQIQWLNDRY